MQWISDGAFGRPILAVATIAFGIACFLQRDFTIFWQPVPDNVPFRQPLAFLSAGLLVLSGTGLLFARTVRPAALLQIILFLAYAASWLSRFSGPAGLGSLLGIAEHVSIAIGAAIVWADARSGGGAEHGMSPTLARVVFGICSIVFALAHFIGARQTAELVPVWLPGSGMFWALFTGVGHLAVGLALIVDRLAILSTRLAGLMYGCFAALVWAPGAVTNPDQWLRWAGLAITLAMLGGVWIVGDYLWRVAGTADDRRVYRLARRPA